MVVVPVLLVTFPAESMFLDSIPRILTISAATANENDTWMILLLWSRVHRTVVPTLPS